MVMLVFVISAFYLFQHLFQFVSGLDGLLAVPVWAICLLLLSLLGTVLTISALLPLEYLFLIAPIFSLCCLVLLLLLLLLLALVPFLPISILILLHQLLIVFLLLLEHGLEFHELGFAFPELHFDMMVLLLQLFYFPVCLLEDLCQYGRGTWVRAWVQRACRASAMAICYFSILYKWWDLTNQSEMTTSLYYFPSLPGSLPLVFLPRICISCCTYFLTSDILLLVLWILLFLLLRLRLPWLFFSCAQGDSQLVL